MRHLLLATAVLAVLVGPASAQATGDFDCVTDLDGPDTPAGILRIEEDLAWSFLSASGEPLRSSTMDYIDDDLVLFDDALADHMSPGAIVAEARWAAEQFAYTGAIVTTDGKQASFSCLYVP